MMWACMQFTMAQCQGGESTREEMCLSFAYFYPLPPDGIFLEYCQSLPSGSSFNQFYGTLARLVN